MQAADRQADPGEMTVDLKVPLFSPSFSKFPVAEVNGEPILLGELNQALVSSNEPGKGLEIRSKADFSKVLDRLINAKLVLQEAAKIGIDELPEIEKMASAYSRMSRRQLLLSDYLKNVRVEVKESDVEKIYRDNVREHKIHSLFFRKEEQARKVEEELKAGKDFNEVAVRAIADNTAQGGKEGGYIQLANAQPAAAAAVAKMKVGSVSPVVKVLGGFVIVKLEEIRYPENPEEREKARKTATTAAGVRSLEEYKRDLIKKYAKADQKLVASVDFESRKPGFEALLKDKRTVVRIQGEKPVTVGEWAKALRDQYYHGVALATESKRLNKKKVEVLDEIVVKKLLEKEALKTGIPNRDDYKAMVDEYRDSLIFGAFLQKVVSPEVKISQEEIDAYYKDHAKEFTTPEMVRISGLAFGNMGAAEAALGKLQKGSDFKWMKDNAEAQLPASTPGLLEWKGDLVTTGSLPEEARKAISGARAGDYRLYASPEGHAYVLFVTDLVPSTIRPLEEVRETIASKVYNGNFQKAVEGWFEKLRNASDIKIHLADRAAK